MMKRAGVLVLVALLAVRASNGWVLDGVWEAVSNAVANVRGLTATSPSSKMAPLHYNGVEVVDLSTPGLPKVRMGMRVLDLVHGGHFDDILQDTPGEIRPPSVVAFFDSSDEECMARFDGLHWDFLAERELPARERLMVARYDMHSAPRRAWYKFTPEMDLAKRFGVTACPEVVFAPRACDGMTEWCERGPDATNPGVTLVGCEDFTDECAPLVQRWSGEGVLKAWLKQKIRAEGEPRISAFFGTFAQQGLWMRKRDTTSSDNHMRNMYLAQAFPAFTKTGFKAMPIPKEMNDWLLGFYERNKAKERTESWDAESTQMSFHENPTKFVDLDRERALKEKMANELLKPLVEEWSGMKDLELTSFYGMREYPDGAWLKNHVDRIDTHVLSVTISVLKHDPEKEKEHPWPLEVVQWTGDHVRYNHPNGTMVLYESSKLPHGRPYRNAGGPHVGCFVHFKPRQMHGADAAKWDGIAETARMNQKKHVQWGVYKSTPSQEPEIPVFSEVSYGDKTSWKHAEGADEPAPNNADMMDATFANHVDRVLDVYWTADDGDVVKQGSIGKGASFKLNTFPGHRFFFAEKDSTEPLPGSTMTMDKGKSTYSYSIE